MAIVNSALRLISPDDHIQEPAHLWQSRVSAKFRAGAPRVERKKGRCTHLGDGYFEFIDDTEKGFTADVWQFDGRQVPILRIAAAVGKQKEPVPFEPCTFEDIREGCYNPKARLLDMDRAGILASVNYPNMFIMFAGELLSKAKDKELALGCIRAYNDFIMEEWCAGSGGRLVPMGIVPLWDPKLAEQEALRLAKLGFHSISFVEAPHRLGYASVSSKQWDGLFRVCQDSKMVLSIHVGTSPMPLAAPDCPSAVTHASNPIYLMVSMLEYMFSGVFGRFPGLKLNYAEAQLGLVPYFLERGDFIWNEMKGDGTGNIDRGVMAHPPSYYFKNNVWVSFFRDPVGISLIDRLGVDNVLFETDYPHLDTEWPECRTEVEKMLADISPDKVEKVVAGNARKLFRVEV